MLMVWGSTEPACAHEFIRRLALVINAEIGTTHLRAGVVRHGVADVQFDLVFVACAGQATIKPTEPYSKQCALDH
jgi:hypothetical protein